MGAPKETKSCRPSLWPDLRLAKANFRLKRADPRLIRANLKHDRADPALGA